MEHHYKIIGFALIFAIFFTSMVFFSGNIKSSSVVGFSHNTIYSEDIYPDFLIPNSPLESGVYDCGEYGTPVLFEGFIACEVIE